MSADVEQLRLLAAGRALKLVRIRARMAGERDHGRNPLEEARTGHRVMGIGNLGVTASLTGKERFLHGNEEALCDVSLKSAKKRRPSLPPAGMGRA